MSFRGLVCCLLGLMLLACGEEEKGGSSRRSLGFCGDGKVDAGESCDGADLAGKSCVDLGWGGGELRCGPDCSFDVSGCTRETCDNGRDDDGDGLVDCTDEDCRGDEACSYCGNGRLDPGESCDGADLGSATCESVGFDGGTLACARDCELDTSGCERLEICDNGLDDDGDGWADCDDDDCVSAEMCRFCGNGRLELGESCDGADLGGATCESLGFDEGNLSCTSACGLDTSGCRHRESCGNGVDDDGDGLIDCDDPDCEEREPCPRCGDGAINRPGETCDGPIEGGCEMFGLVGELACTGCLIDLSGCQRPTCGDGVAEGFEPCDDGNDLYGDGCTPRCELEVDVCEVPLEAVWEEESSTWVAGGSLLFDSWFPFPGSCGDFDGGRAAAVQFTAPAAGRYFARIDAANFDAALFATRGSCDTHQVCTDLTLRGMEEIEIDLAQGETVHFVVGTSEFIEHNPEYTRFTARIGAVACGDGVVQGWEECDDGNLVAGDGCNALCRFEGDGCSDAIDIDDVGSRLADWPELFRMHYRDANGARFWHGSTLGRRDDFALSGSCGVGAGPDAVGRFQAPVAGTYSVRVHAPFAARVFAAEEACSMSGTALACAETPGNEKGVALLGDMGQLQLAAGQEIFFVVDGASAGEAGEFWLEITWDLCGNGVVDGAEQCDDGNRQDGDGCSAACLGEARVEEREPNTTISAAQLVPEGYFVDASFRHRPPAVDRDVFAFLADEGATYAIWTSGPQGWCPSILDSYLRILDRNETVLAENDDAGPTTRCSRVEFTAPATDTYYVELRPVSMSWGKIGRYFVDVFEGIDYHLWIEPLPAP